MVVFLYRWYNPSRTKLRNTKYGDTMPGMITVSIREMAEKRGVTTAYQLQKALDVSPSLAAKWWRNDMKMIGIDTLDRLCTVLKCKPNEILRYGPSEE
jgi:DNA-binding Xre family transcriptional regulator